MANIKSAKKRITVIENKTAQNKRVRDHLKEALKNYDLALESGNLEDAEQKLRIAEKKLMKAATKNVIHKNAASRRVSGLYKRLNKAKAE
ncbi:MAG: 30S ribosomal protein S20 [Anaerovoracaceae bacterium]|nr:30S ribosomal protein S20 [Bacillota bacterium]MDY2670298.1 30S ribosomal protein S20 [Anaerovoracaceae bacterium]